MRRVDRNRRCARARTAGSRCAGLPPGEYEVASSKPGFKKNVLRVSLKPAAPAALKIVLQLGSLSETITVAAPRDRLGIPAPSAAASRAADETPRPDPCDNSPVGGCVTPPRKLVNVMPAYPPALAAKKAAADVVVKATLRTDGLLGGFQPEAGPDPAFVEAVLGAIRQWKFTPAKLNGVPQECQVTVTVKFVAGNALASQLLEALQVRLERLERRYAFALVLDDVPLEAAHRFGGRHDAGPVQFVGAEVGVGLRLRVRLDVHRHGAAGVAPDRDRRGSRRSIPRRCRCPTAG